jgi:hypothetical protein
VRAHQAEDANIGGIAVLATKSDIFTSCTIFKTFALVAVSLNAT